MGLRRQRASDNSAMSATDLSSALYLNAGVQARIYEPHWEKGLPTAVKILPEWDKRSKKFLPYRDAVTEDARSLGNFRMVLPIIKWAGAGDKKTALSCILYDPAALREGEYDSKTNPYIVFREAIRSAAYGDEQELKLWGKRCNTAAWLKFFTGKLEDKILPNPQMAAFMQAIFYTARGKAALKGDDATPLGLGSDDVAHILLVTEKANKDTEELMCDVTQEFHANATIDELDSVYTYGDPTRLDGGLFYVLVNPKEPAEQTFESVTKREQDDDDFLPEKIGDFSSYVPGFVDRLSIRSKETRKNLVFDPDLSEHEKLIKSKMLDWFEDDVFRIMSDEELAVKVAEAYSARPELLEYGWSSHPEYFNLDEVQAKLKSRTQGFVPGAGDSDDSDEDTDEDGEDTFSAKRRRKKLREGSKAAEAAKVYDNVGADMTDEEESTSRRDRRKRRRRTSSDASEGTANKPKRKVRRRRSAD